MPFLLHMAYVYMPAVCCTILDLDLSIIVEHSVNVNIEIEVY